MSSPPRAIVITGASHGIGAALARAYARPGVTLGLTGRHAARLAAVAQDCLAQGAQVQTGCVDVADEAGMRTWLQAFDARTPVDLLIANAGVAHTLKAGEVDESADVIRSVFAVNTHGVFNTLTPLIESMRHRRRGQIGIISSLSAYVGMPISPAYCASKAAVKVYGEALRGCLAAHGVGVTVVCPGFVKTDMSDRFPGPTPFRISAEQAARLIQRGLSSNCARVSFPFPLNLGMWFLSVLPPSLGLWLQKRFGFG